MAVFVGTLLSQPEQNPFAMATQVLVEFERVSKSYPAGWLGRRRESAVREVSFRVFAGEVFALVGPNRAGKSTLIKLLLSLCRPSAGKVWRFGRPSTDPRTLARIGYVHDSQAFPRYLTAVELLKYYGALALVPYEDVCRRVPVLLERVGLADRAREPISHFSKGMIQRLGLAQSLLNDPQLLVLDEPNEGLDLEGRQLVAELVEGQRRRGRTVLLVSHVLPEVERLCDRVGVLREGRLLHCGPLDGLVRADRAPDLTRALSNLYEGARS